MGTCSKIAMIAVHYVSNGYSDGEAWKKAFGAMRMFNTIGTSWKGRNPN